jgi:hypothetical protein
LISDPIHILILPDRFEVPVRKANTVPSTRFGVIFAKTINNGIKTRH